jgi:bifunctional enzyme CysN/CysC
VAPVSAIARGAREPDLLRFATAGSVDDGKSTLIGRLLHDSGALYEDHIEALRKAASRAGGDVDFSLITDGLKAEREQGITIDVAYRYFSTSRRRFIIADTPGHEQYTRNMVTGASTADVAVLLVDATLGVSTQSRRHGFIASLLGVPRVVVAVNKMDLVGYDRAAFEKIRDDYRDFAAKLGFADLAFIPLSALKGDNVVEISREMKWHEGGTLLSYLENVYVGGDANLVDFRFPVQRAVRPDGSFRGYAGTVCSGVVRPGDEVVVLPSGRRTRVRRIVTMDGDLDYAFAPLTVTLCLEDEVDVGRGDMLAHPNNVPRTEREIDAMVVWMADTPLRTGTPYLIKHTTRQVKASFAEILYRVHPDTLHRENADTLGLNEIGRVRATLFGPLFVDAYRRNRHTGSFIVIDPATNATVGTGMMTERTAAAVRPQAATDATVSLNIKWQKAKVSADDRATFFRHESATIWLTGLSASGKSTLAFTLEKRLMDLGHACCVLDGDNVRHGLNRDLGFSPADRKENVRRIAETAKLLNDAGLFVIAAFISPYRDDRQTAREIIGPDRFIETYLSADVATCEKRDPKGLYAKARAGDIPEFTGVSAPYEPPLDPNIVVDTRTLTPEQCADALIALVATRFRS